MPTLTLNQLVDPARFTSTRVIVLPYKDPSDIAHTGFTGDKILVILTGIVNINESGSASGWRRETLDLIVKFPGIVPAGLAFHIEQWAPLITINGIAKEGQVANAGWAVEAFRLIGRITVRAPDGHETIAMQADIAARGVDDVIHQIAYSLTVTGKLVAQPPAIP